MERQRLTKADHVREWISREIRNGNFARGSALPPELELAERAGVSYMTLRKAVGALVQEGLLERTKGSGTFVRNEISERKVQKILGLAIPAWASPENLDTLMYFTRACEEAGWILKTASARNWEDRAVHDLWENSDALVLTGIQEMHRMPAYLRRKLRESAKPVIVNKGSGDLLGRDSVYYLPDERMEEPCDRLYALGHRRILLVDQATRHDGRLATIHPNLRGFEAVFREKYPDVDYNARAMTVEVPLFQLPHPTIRHALAERREELSGYTAIVCPLSFYWPVMSGLKDCGARVPEDVSVLAFGDRQEAEYYDPRPATFSVLLRDQANRTLELIRWRLQNPDAPPRSVQTDTRFLEGETLAPARTPPPETRMISKSRPGLAELLTRERGTYPPTVIPGRGR